MNFLDVKSITTPHGDVKTIYINGDVAWTKGVTDDTPTYIKLLKHTMRGSYKNESATSVGDYAFYSSEKLTRADFSEAISIGEYAFYNCPLLTSVNFPKVTTIGNFAFADCIRLSKVRFPSAIEVGACVFQNCTSLTTAVFDVAVKIGETGDAFDECSKLSTLILCSDTLCMISSGSLNDTQIANGDGCIYVPSSLINDYKIADGWSDYASKFKTIEDNMDIIGGLIS